MRPRSLLGPLRIALVVVGIAVVVGSATLLLTNRILVAVGAWSVLGGLGLLAVLAALGCRLADGASALVGR